MPVATMHGLGRGRWTLRACSPANLAEEVILRFSERLGLKEKARWRSD